MELNDLDVKMNQYINNELAGEELAEFEDWLANNAVAKKEIAFHKQVDQILIAKKRPSNKNELKATFQRLGQKYILNEIGETTKAKVIKLKQVEPPATDSSNKGVLRWLAPVIGIAAAALFFFFIGFGDIDPQQLAQDNFTPYAFEATFRSDRNDNLVAAQQAYDNKDFQKAKNLLSQHPENILAQIAKGNCEFLLNEPAKAIQTFKQISNKKMDINVKAQVQWYLALSYLKNKNETGAKNTLLLIPKQSNYYKEAQTILNKLD